MTQPDSTRLATRDWRLRRTSLGRLAAERGSRAALLACCLSAAVLLSACSSGPLPITQGRAFPPDLRQTEVLDIQVFRHDTRIEFTNTTARSIPAGTMWLNRRFSRQMPAIAVGQSFELALDEFQDEFGEAFRAGGFFATREPETLVQAQIETTDAEGKPTLLGLIVIGR